ncbi:hypothetical protein EYZ11_012978 [Aspergillus tanneri]|uniref:Thioester reductase (TE) domain-containing protein n=1 Tax=Aspergillus tanneri TaxID=1220188 RepID=A0A4V3UMK6_9EURO|nr:hypothetical protein EYZ11_012978 [Aspergillus tanneri]
MIGHLSTHGSISVDLMVGISRHDSKIAATQQLPARLNGANGKLLTYRIKPFTVLLTGANGFIGTHKSCASSSNTTMSVASLPSYGALWWSNCYAEKLEVWPGDLSLPRLGLEPVRWNSLGDGKMVDVIIHNGATVHWVESYAALEATNVSSTMELLQPSLASHVRFIYITGGRRWDSREEREEDVAKELSATNATGYSQTKFVAEAVVKRAARRSVSISRSTVVSPGLVIGTPTEGVTNADDYIWRLTAACIRVGAYNANEADAWLSLSDVATTATTVVDAGLAAEAETIEAHFMDGMTCREFWEILGELGYRLEAKCSAGWLAALRADIEAGREIHALWPLAHMLSNRVAQEGALLAGSWREKRGDTPLRLKMGVRRSAEFRRVSTHACG